MQKFALLFLAASTALLGLVAPVEGVALVDRETNADRFARGLPPLSPRAPTQREVAKRSKPSKRDPTPTVEERDQHHPFKRALIPALELRSKPSKRADSPAVEKRSKPSKRADTPTVERRSSPSKRANAPTVERRSSPSKRANTPTVERRSSPSKRANTPSVERRSSPSKRANTPTVERRSSPSKRADTPTVQRRSSPSKRADTPTVQRRSKPSKRADTPTVQRRSKPSKRADTPTVQRRSKPSKRAETPTIERRSGPSKRADTPTIEKRSWPSKRATPATVEKRSKPSKRAETPTVEKRSKPSKRATVETVEKLVEAEVFNAPNWHLSSGRLEVRWACNDSIAGYVANNPTGGSFGLNDAKPGEDDLYVEYFDSNLMVMNPEFPPPYFVGGGDAASSVHDCSNKIRFGAVELGSSSAVWSLCPMSGALNATLTNQDGSEDEPSLVFDSARNVLSFTHDVNRSPATELPVYVYLSD